MVRITNDRSSKRGLVLAIAALFAVSCAATPYMKMNPPPDADKTSTSGTNNSCWLATASNMLAGVGYGSGTNVQDRADDIYGDMVTHYTIANGGWTDTALTWWLGSSNNTWTTNPYTVVTVSGNKSPALPWANANGPEFMGNCLRACMAVGISISWPTNAVQNGVPVVGSGGHAITGWGDPGADTVSISSNPTGVRLTDSDNDTGGDVQVYNYDAFASPNPGGANEGNGWYLNYSANHPYIKHIVTLEPTDDPSDDKLTQKVIGSYEITQDNETAATDLHYDVSTDVGVLTYRTRTTWEADGSPSITETGSPRDGITVDWKFTKKPVPVNTEVRITTEFVLPSWNAMTYDNVHFTYPADSDAGRFPTLSWNLETPRLDGAEQMPNVTGGYVIGAFEVMDRSGEQVAAYRLVHQYAYSQDPELHVFSLRGDPEFSIANLRFGHSYGLPDDDELWAFEQWLAQDKEPRSLSEPIQITLDWDGQLPYPKGEDITQAIFDLEEGLKRDR